MTRKTYPRVLAGIVLSASALTTPIASAYFAVSVPSSAITMSGVRHEAPVAPVAPLPAPAATAAQTERKAALAESRQVKRSLLRVLFLSSP